MCACNDGAAQHNTAKPYACTLCGECERFRPKRREWRRVADPNRKDIAKAIADAKVLRIRAGDYSDDSPAAIAVAQRAAHDAPPPASAPLVTFADVARRFIQDYVRPPVYARGEKKGVKLSGMQDHAGVRGVIERILIPSPIGSAPIDQITFPDMEALRNARLAAPKLRGGKTVVVTTGTRSIARVNREMAVARMVFNFALELRLIERSPMQPVGRRRSLVVIEAERERDRVLSDAEETAMLAAYPSRSVDYFVFALETGLRESEMRGLEVRDVDQTAGSCGVTTPRHKHGTGKCEPCGLIHVRWEIAKSKKERTVPMSRAVRDILQRRMATRPDPSARLFDDVSPTLAREDFIAAKASANVTDFQMRDCRATLATRLLHRGLAERDIAWITGHRFYSKEDARGGGSAPILEKHYLRSTPEMYAHAATLITNGSQSVN